ncbi:uncharacterized protein K452DRAFT_282362 [Aplosporella prunicola CBS 121167]|uniref:DUF1772 domain-containing protein n=1 Tax=Aplosporella prunicola CBS 121167 TaxID=1176127 RepID=A0A6A6BTE6_9PEZI|nr:uncharacterized protein K452DRAFT_282362 [Aplosporella prunicola CBS 121167]KAF2147356.1 hypothetical protein K452DRAFT_282362 [Aplosporella prunicola CBS 121167]
MPEHSAQFHFQQLPGLVRTAHIVGVTSSAFLSGYIGCFSIAMVPTLGLAPAPLLAQQFESAYNIGASTAPFLALTGGISFGYLMWQQGKALTGTELNPNSTFYLYSAAAILIPSIVPFTLLAMKRVNNRLHAKAAALKNAQPGDDAWNEVGIPEEDKVKTLLGKWTWFNATRSVLTGVGALCGILAVS